MYVKLKCITPNIEENIVEIARVSSSRKNLKDNPQGLINYLIKKKHWSPFEHGFITFEVETSRGIAAQLLRHRSNFFQEFSQRYQDVNILSNGSIFEVIDIRKQAVINRQSSTESFDPELEDYADTYDMVSSLASDCIDQYLKQGHALYDALIAAGVAKECARFVLPLAVKTRMFITMNVRSVLHWLELRDDPHAQKEVNDIAIEIKKIVEQELPLISNAKFKL